MIKKIVLSLFQDLNVFESEKLMWVRNFEDYAPSSSLGPVEPTSVQIIIIQSTLIPPQNY